MEAHAQSFVMPLLDDLLADESRRQQEFPVVREHVFLAHAGVTILPRRVTKIMQEHLEASCLRMQEYPEAWKAVTETRGIAARLIAARSSEISLIGPTSVGLSLVASGLPWRAGDEIVINPDDYPANVYPWRDLERHGVVIRELRPERLGEITPQLVEEALTPRTRLVALASCHYLSGYRIDVDAIGRLVRGRGIWFCLDAIQTVGAFDTRVDHVDFLSADSHKWMLGPMTAGLFYVRDEWQEILRPGLLGSWNVRSPNFIAQSGIEFERGGRRYEPGALNINGILGMRAGIELIEEMGINAISHQLLQLKKRLHERLAPLGFEFLGPSPDSPSASGITTVWHPQLKLETIQQGLATQQISVSLRHTRDGRSHIRFSPHFYNTLVEMDRVADVIETLVADQ